MSGASQGKSVNKSLYILKAFCAFGVVILHIYSHFDLHIYGIPFIRIAVPCFLLISGYFLVDGQSISKVKVDKQIKKILGLVILINLIYFLISLILNAVSGGPVILPEWRTAGFWIRQLFIGDNLCVPYWYLTAYLIGLLLIRFSGEKLQVYFLAPILMIVAVALSHYSFLFFGHDCDPVWSRNGLLCAYPCLLAGIYIRKNEEAITGTPFLKTAGIAAVLTILAYIECLIFRELDITNVFDYFLLTFPLAISIFILALSFEKFLKDGNLPKPVKSICSFIGGFGQRHATNIYLLHPIIILVIVTICENWLNLRAIRNAECVFLISIVASEILIRLKRLVK